MSRVNWVRFVVGGLIASVIAFVTDGILHELLIHDYWEALVERLHMTPREHAPSGPAYFAIFELGRGVALSVTGPVQFIPLGFFSETLWFIAGAYQLVTSIVATTAGAAVYAERG